ncbi:TPM domain-containing protein [Streptomyces roseifaciens]|uniref:TPM domain-containing protein n=1 Tax=Streptomyces roseifaciens TaxID=1488406 RepID=UPI0007182F14|nr:TPM domain-containing protein [Streptomyces roseifaciens]
MTRLSRRYGKGAPGRAVAGALLVLCALLLPAPATRADTPLDLDAGGRITDTVGALGRRRAQVTTAIERLRTTQRVQLYVTYVRDFSGRSARAWADATADRNGLGEHEVLLAVATHGQQYAVSADKRSGFRADQLKAVADTAIAPAVAQHDWAGAAIGAADGYRAVLRGEPVRPPAISPGSKDPGGEGLVPGHRRVWLPVAMGAGLCLLGLYLCARRTSRRRRAEQEQPYAPATVTPPGLARLAQPLTPLPELDAEAVRALVGTDDAVRTSAEELLFAAAQLGEEAARPFAEAVAYAKEELADAFRLRQALDDAPYEDEDIRRRTLDEICSHCTSANRRLDAESESFDRLRGLRANAAGILARAEADAQSLSPRVATAEAALAALAGHCTAAALAAVARHPGEARDRLSFATAALTEARRALAADDSDGAAISLRAGEAALSQARVLTLAALRRAHELTGATRRLPAALAEAEARAPRGSPQARALACARREVESGRYDPRAVLRHVEETAAALDAGHEDRARARAGRALRRVRGEVAAARDFVTTHRGAIGCRARTRLAEAERHLALARTAGDLRTVRSETGHADSLARQARALAEHDVGTYGTRYDPGTPPPARALGGALLGGIVLAGLLPATFGGGATRGRLAAG